MEIKLYELNYMKKFKKTLLLIIIILFERNVILIMQNWEL